MLQWLSENIGTILVSLILIAVVTLILILLRRDRKKGVSSCGNRCSSCPMAGKCHNAGKKS